MLVFWCLIEGCLLPLPTPRTAVFGVSVLDDEGMVRAWEVMQAQPSLGIERWSGYCSRFGVTARPR